MPSINSSPYMASRHFEDIKTQFPLIAFADLQKSNHLHPNHDPVQRSPRLLQKQQEMPSSGGMSKQNIIIEITETTVSPLTQNSHPHARPYCQTRHQSTNSKILYLHVLCFPTFSVFTPDKPYIHMCSLENLLQSLRSVQQLHRSPPQRHAYFLRVVAR